jgi:hypothetical protein
VIALGARVKKPGDQMVSEPTELKLVYNAEADEMGAYERLLGDALAGDATLFARQDSVEAAWSIVEPILHATTPVHDYAPGTWGPPDAARLTEEVGGWHDVGGPNEPPPNAMLRTGEGESKVSSPAQVVKSTRRPGRRRSRGERAGGRQLAGGRPASPDGAALRRR